MRAGMKTGTEGETMEERCQEWLAPQLAQLGFLRCAGGIPPEVGCALSHQALIKKMPTDLPTGSLMEAIV